MDGDKKYSPPRGKTKRLSGKSSEVATFSGSVPVMNRGPLTSCPIYIIISIEFDEICRNVNTYESVKSATYSREPWVIGPL
jgi:hypothetical protein